jgi:hypothetical protein
MYRSGAPCSPRRTDVSVSEIQSWPELKRFYTSWLDNIYSRCYSIAVHELEFHCKGVGAYILSLLRV